MASWGGLMNLRGRPDLVIVFNTKVDYLAVKEAMSIGIPTVALMDTNADVSGVNYPIVANDGNAHLVKFFCEEFVKAITAGQKETMKESGVDMAQLLRSKQDKKEEKKEAVNA